MVDIFRTSLLLLSILVGAGGVAGFLKAQSKASLIAGLVSATLLVVSYSISLRNAHWGLVAGAIICGLLVVVFGIRLKKTGKFMPSGMLLAVCGIELIALVVALTALGL